MSPLTQSQVWLALFLLAVNPTRVFEEKNRRKNTFVFFLFPEMCFVERDEYDEFVLLAIFTLHN